MNIVSKVCVNQRNELRPPTLGSELLHFVAAPGRIKGPTRAPLSTQCALRYIPRIVIAINGLSSRFGSRQPELNSAHSPSKAPRSPCRTGETERAFAVDAPWLDCPPLVALAAQDVRASRSAELLP